MLVPQQACSQGSRVFCANLTPLTPVLWDQSLSKPEGIPDSLSSLGPAAQESEAQLDTYIKYKTFGHLMCQKHFLERLNTPASDCVQRGGGCQKPPLPGQHIIFISLSVRGPVKPSWEAAGALWDKAQVVLGLWSKPAEWNLCYSGKWRTLLHMNSALPD